MLLSQLLHALRLSCADRPAGHTRHPVCGEDDSYADDCLFTLHETRPYVQAMREVAADIMLSR